MLTREARVANFSVVDLIRLGFEPPTFYTWSERLICRLFRVCEKGLKRVGMILSNFVQVYRWSWPPVMVTFFSRISGVNLTFVQA